MSSVGQHEREYRLNRSAVAAHSRDWILDPARGCRSTHSSGTPNGTDSAEPQPAKPDIKDAEIKLQLFQDSSTAVPHDKVVILDSSNGTTIPDSSDLLLKAPSVI
jgi:hypothetical protein